MPPMKSHVFQLSVILFAAALCASASGQTPSGNDKSSPQLEALTKKIDEQNTKIDALSQQILKLEQQLSTIRPGIMIGESTPPRQQALPPPPSLSPRLRVGMLMS